MMKYCLLIAVLLVPASVWAQCSNTAYGGGITCVQAPIPVANGATGSAAAVVISFANTTTPGHGVLIFGDYCSTLNCATAGSPIANVTVTDDVMDTGFQSCSNNGSIAYIRYFYCWWLPAVGSAKVFTLHANGSYSATIWVAEFSGACNTTGCIGTDVPAVYCMAPCGPQIVTSYTNVLVAAFGYSPGTVLTPTPAWKNISSAAPGSGIGNFQATPGPYVPQWSNTVMVQAFAVSIKSLTSASTQITVPTMPVF